MGCNSSPRAYNLSNIQYMYMIGKLKIYYLSEPCKLGEKLTFGEVILPVSHQMQTYFIFIDIVCVLCLSCNVKKSKHQRSIVFILPCQKVLRKVLKKKVKKKVKKTLKKQKQVSYLSFFRAFYITTVRILLQFLTVRSTRIKYQKSFIRFIAK